MLFSIKGVGELGMDKTYSDIARECFIEHGFSYADVTEKAFWELVSILKLRLAQENRNRDKNADLDYRFSIKDKSCKYQKATKDRPFQAYISVELDNYTERPAISFNPNGWIGFAGWASSSNVKPFTDAFMEWVRWLVSQNNKNVDNTGVILEVNHLPAMPPIGTVVIKEDITYVYTNTGWKIPNTLENKLRQISVVVRDSKDCPLKQKVMEILTT